MRQWMVKKLLEGVVLLCTLYLFVSILFVLFTYHEDDLEWIINYKV
jgi:hypothetical protein